MGRRAKHPSRPAGRLSCGIDIPDEHAPAVRAQQVSAITRLTRPLMLVNLINAILLIAVLRFTEQLSPLALVWGGVAAAVSLLSLLRAQLRGKRPTPAAVSRRTIRRVVRSSALFGLLWAVPGLVVLPGSTGLAQAFCASLLTGMVGGGAIALYPIPMAAAVFAAFVCLGSILGLAFHGMPLAAAFAASATGFFFVFTRVILQHTRTFVDEYVGRLELEKRNKLISDLLEQTQLEAVGERQRSEQRLVRAQKMEAIGQLTGGVAHDFNNLLAAIQGHAELIELEGRADPHLVTPILSATARGAALIQRLLSVARKQVLKPEAVDLGALVRELLLLLQRTLGPHIRIETQVPEGLWWPLADAGQLEGALLNLALNARGAMPDGGTLVIECANVDADSVRRRPLELAPGDYVEIVVRDTGHGMSPAVRERALDPFFTTKKFGSGSGLGLSIVAGFIQQSDGQIQIESAPGAGTAVHLLLPRAEAAHVAPDLRAPRRTAVGNGETILVVEDEADVRDITVRMLEGLNYHVLTSGDARDALRKIVTDRTIDLVLTDILLPGGMTGFELARNVDRMAPALPVTFMSGYARNPVEGPQADDPHGAVLPKPFQRQQLAEHVRTALNLRTQDAQKAS